MATISDSGEAMVQKSNYPEKTSISRVEFSEDSMMIVSFPPLENDSVGEISLKKQVITSSVTSISEKDGEMIPSASIEVSISENEVMNTEVLSLLETDSTFLEDDKVGGDLQQFKETYAANVSLSEVSKEEDRFGDDVHKIEEVGDTDEVIDSISDSLKPEKKGQDSDAQRLLEPEKRRLQAEVEDGTIFRKRVDVETLAGAPCIKEQHDKLETFEVKDNAFVGRSLKIALIDDTALVDVVSFNKKAKDHPKRPVTGRTEKNAPRKHKKIGEKPIDKGNASIRVCEFHNSGGSNGKQFRIMYSGKQMEVMRYADMENQQKLWSDLYARLLPELVTEYEGLVRLKNQKTSKPNLRESGIGILGPILAVPRRNRVNVFVH